MNVWMSKASIKSRREIEWSKIVMLAIDKGVGSGKANIKKGALDIVCNVFETLEDVQGIIEIVVEQMNSKTAKTSVAGV